MTSQATPFTSPGFRLPSFLTLNYRYSSALDQQQAVGLLRMVQGMMLVSLLAIIIVLIDPGLWQGNILNLSSFFDGRGAVPITMVILSSVVTLVVVTRLLNRGQLKMAGTTFVLDTVVITTLIYTLYDPTVAIIIIFTVPVVAAGVLLGLRQLTVITTLVIAMIVGRGVLFTTGTVPSGWGMNQVETVIVAALVLLLNVVMLQVFSGGRLLLLSERARLSDELQALNQNLEQRVADRTRDLVLAAEVSREAVSVMDLDTLLPRVADLTREAFNLYHVSIFVYDEATNVLRLEAGTGEAGFRLKNINKRFRIDTRGLVPQAARERRAVMVNNTATEANFFPNPILPDTRSEVVLPMLFSNRLVGVLDMQSNQLNRFTADDLRVFQNLADQIAVAVRNSQLFAETEAARVQAEKADQVKSMFLASMSHELRTPLNAIINFTKFVARGVMGPVTPKQIDTLTNVIDSAEHLLSLINDVLDISKIEAGSLSLFMQDDVDLAEIITGTEKTARTLIGEKPVDFVLDLEPNLPLITGDHQRILQVVLNIVSNACKFTKTGEIRVTASQADGAIVVGVSDTGPGIAPEDHTAVFEKFKQTHTGLRQGSGTGLGMPISRSLVEAHGGRLWIESIAGSGATFKFTLPIQRELEGDSVNEDTRRSIITPAAQPALQPARP